MWVVHVRDMWLVQVRDIWVVQVRRYEDTLRDVRVSVYLSCCQEWKDEGLQWDPVEYGGVKTLFVPSKSIWLPELVLYNK